MAVTSCWVAITGPSTCLLRGESGSLRLRRLVAPTRVLSTPRDPTLDVSATLFGQMVSPIAALQLQGRYHCLAWKGGFLPDVTPH